jgi:hypothetical protein
MRLARHAAKWKKWLSCHVINAEMLAASPVERQGAGRQDRQRSRISGKAPAAARKAYGTVISSESWQTEKPLAALPPSSQLKASLQALSRWAAGCQPPFAAAGAGSLAAKAASLSLSQRSALGENASQTQKLCVATKAENIA